MDRDYKQYLNKKVQVLILRGRHSEYLADGDVIEVNEEKKYFVVEDIMFRTEKIKFDNRLKISLIN